ncbi:MAG TPA: SDR family oxidoreductase [Steroidobacteraceae bacterium]|nr:SDR family oxidoreductase [Steroidobacteraceae bacterium]
MSTLSDPNFVNPLSLRSRRILVTGAASGIGRITCALLSRLEARVAAVDLDQTGLESLELPGEGHARRCLDLENVDAIPAWMAELALEGGPLSGLVHAAGASCVQPLRLLTPALYRKVLLLNTEAALALARGFQKKAVRDPQGGSIVLISSVMATAGASGAAAYSLSKSALHGLARALAVELAPDRIRVNCVAPGFVRTPMFDRMAALWDPAQLSRVEAAHPLGLGTAADVANSIAFLLADTARWITGSVLTVDGGYTAQ